MSATTDRYDKMKAGSFDAYKKSSRTLRDIGEIPPPRNERTRRLCQYDFRKFCEEYFPMVFYLPWSDDQLRCIDKIQTVVLDGGLFALAMPRGSGKTALCQSAIIWAQAYGHRRYSFFIGDDQESAEDSLLSIKTEWEANPDLQGDFPEIGLPLSMAEGIGTRFRGQLCYEKRVQCFWGSNKIVLPSVVFPECPKEWRRWLNETDDGWVSVNAGVTTRTKGITGGIRGAIFKHPVTGELLRPDLFIADDIQTDQVAESPARIHKITRYLEGAVQGLAGPGEVISGIMPCTVIQQGDISDTFLDPMKKPEWKGERCGMVLSWPQGITDTEISEDSEAGRHWNEYARKRLESLQQFHDIHLATNYYRQYREIMDEGFTISWEDRYNKDPKLLGNQEISAQQHAMNLRISNPETFASEYQNFPLLSAADLSEMPTVDQICARTTDIAKNQVPQWCEHISAFIDIQDEVAFYTVLATSSDFSGVIIDYGTFPQFSQGFVTKAQTESWCQLSRSYFEKYPQEKSKGTKTGMKLKAPFEPKIHFLLEQLVGILLQAQYKRDDGSVMPIGRVGIDANWGKTTDLVKRFCRYHGDQRLCPMHGRFFGATTKPLHEWQRRTGWLFEDQLHHGIEKVSWAVPANTTGIRHVLVDTNYYKSFLMNRLSSPLGTPGAIVLFKAEPRQHEMFANHLVKSEYPEAVTAKGVTVDEWQVYPNRHDNDFLDCMVGCLCLASMQGACLRSVSDRVVYKDRQKRQQKLSDMWRKKRAM